MRRRRAFLIVGLSAVVTLVTLISLALLSRSAEANPLGGITAVSAGEGQTCALTTGGGVKCWGEYLRLTHAAIVPEDVRGLESGVATLSAGSGYVCALTTVGGVKCWGENAPGAVGSTEGPVDIPGLTSGVAAIDAGMHHACAVTVDGAVKCWGANYSGQLGNSSLGNGTGVLPLTSGAVAVSAALEHSCAVLTAGGVKCWGENDFGQLGDGTAIDRLTPVDVVGLSDAVAVAAGATYTCALTSAGGVKCWGDRYGNAPADVAGLTSSVVAISAFNIHACALLTSGGVKCWGVNNYGQLGDAQRCGTAACAEPVDVVGLQSGVAAISAGAQHSCAVTEAGGVKCWGNNYFGQLGDGTGKYGAISAVPVDVVELNVKPTPTATPCPLSGCPTPTPAPTPPRTGLDFSIAVDANGDGIDDCSTRAGSRNECSLPPGSAFTVRIDLHALPPNMPGYAGFDARLDYAGVSSKWKSIAVWPDCLYPASYYANQLIRLACASPSETNSVYVGPIGTSEFNCTGNGSVTLVHGSTDTDLFDSYLEPYAEAERTGETLIVNCGAVVYGDVDCNVAVSAVDATLILQYDASLLRWLSCPQQADVNLDNRANSIDAAVTLQYIAGLVDVLPPQQAGR